MASIISAQPRAPTERTTRSGCQEPETDAKSAAAGDIEAREAVALRQDGCTRAVHDHPFKARCTSGIAASATTNGLIGGHVVGAPNFKALVDGSHDGITGGTARTTGAALGLQVVGTK